MAPPGQLTACLELSPSTRRKVETDRCLGVVKVDLIYLRCVWIVRLESTVNSCVIGVDVILIV